MRRKRRRKFKKINFGLILKFVGAGIFFLFGLVLFMYLGKTFSSTGIFTVKDIKSNVEVDDEVKREIYGKSLFTLNIEKIHSQIFTSHPEFKDVYILKKFPHLLKIEVKQREPFAQIRGKRFYPVDREGIILSSGSQEPISWLISIEIVDYNYLLKKGDKLKDGRIKYVFNLIEALGERNLLNKFPTKVINATSLAALYFVVEDTKIIVGKDSFGRKLSILDELYEKTLKSDFSSVKYIDLRHKKAYVGYER
ncbi:MAG: hypothetical protein KKC11_05860 [Candidatus Omnitrophica bacterium]|nr:hypothetical protein [Candidatus Omnitrophota bacterium]MBU0878428.1 hypothetical protein [Candidatus Omnitrophota bacterium]MBU1133648.1 hypothetical protein [Candidatus Omnitrophota bacterium]MBU1811083.1 hypothetical protein [Candidatus Omnitrophota bacterium]